MQNSLPYQDDKRTNLHRKQVCPCFDLQKQEQELAYLQVPHSHVEVFV